MSIEQTNFDREYGGYLPLELPKRGKDYFDNIDKESIVRLDCGRSAFWYALKDAKPKKLYVPYLNCINSTDPADLLGIPYEYYRLDDELTPVGVNPQENEAIMWINYYGNATDGQIKSVIERFKNTNLIIDNCHAFFSKPVNGAYNCYSARKFFGVCDGAYLIKKDLVTIDLPRSESAQEMLFLLETIEKGTNALYHKNLLNEERLGKQPKGMSILTNCILQSIDYKTIREIRKANLLALHKQIGDLNEFTVNLESDTHMYYPLLICKDGLREKIVQRHIYTPTWWRHVPDYFREQTIETKLSKYMLMIPIDQRYNQDDMKKIAEIIREEYER